MSNVEIVSIDGNCMDDAVKKLAGIEGGAERAFKSAAARAGQYLRTHSGRAIRERYAITQRDLRANENVSVRYSFQHGLSLTITFSGHKIPLYRFSGTNPLMPRKDTTKRISAFINGAWKRTSPSVPSSAHVLKSSAPTTFEDVFTAKMKSGHMGLFERTGGATPTGSDAIRELMGPAVPQMLGNQEVVDKLTKDTAAKFEERIDIEVTRILNGWGK